MVFVAALPRPADAQQRMGARRAVVVRPAIRPVYVRPGYAYAPRSWYYSRWSQWGPYRYPPYGYLRDDLTSSLRIEVSPRDAEVYVDGYLAGEVDDFDGVFQRLRVPPGGHEITIYLDGFRTIRRNVYMSPGGTVHIRDTMERIAAGESSEPPPAPSDVVRGTEPDRTDRAPGRRPVRPEPPAEADRASGDRERRTVRFGTLAIRVQPADAVITIDGERWNPASNEQERASIELAEGRHRIEVRRDGYTPYVEEVLIRRGSTLTLNIDLSRGPVY